MMTSLGWPSTSERVLRLSRTERGARVLRCEGLVAGSGLMFDDAGERDLKVVPDRWHLYRVVS